MKATWEKIFEYASMPVHGTMSRKLRKGLSLQINEGKVLEKAVIFIGEEFLRITEETTENRAVNSYYDWSGIITIRTISAGE
ncbi:MAG: hypothetical protein ISR96_03640 [Nitrospira sp.]|nr:hypothetical protein [bacterium]MBL7048608.1 hypothetical protein [Nitrospira sp.]